MKDKKDRVCPVELAGSLDNWYRRILQNPRKILAPYIREGMTVLDIGCGPGFFSIEIAKMVGEKGRVISADLQEGMLEKLRNKIKNTELEKRIKLVKCDENQTNVSDKVDFILSFYVIHEIQDKNSFFKEMRTILNPNGLFLIVEPKFFHVSKKEFADTIKLAENNGFQFHSNLKMLFSWTAVLK